jgi:hypothetical protein
MKGDKNKCSRAEEYFKQLRVREEKRVDNYNLLTGLDKKTIREKMNLTGDAQDSGNWWKNIWK